MPGVTPQPSYATVGPGQGPLAPPVRGGSPPAVLPTGMPLLSRRQLAEERRALRMGILLSLVWLASFVIGFKAAVAVLTVAGFTMAAIGLRWPMYGVHWLSRTW